MEWRLGIDLGTNSLGWWAFAVSKNGNRWSVTGSLDGGVYIFPDGREPAKGGRVGDSNAVARRNARAMRRNRDRRKARQKAFMRELIALGLMPNSAEQRERLFQSAEKDGDRFNPYRLRAEALERKLSPCELGRALFHLGLRRGFKSNRTEASDDEGGTLKERIDKLDEMLSGRTLGQFLWDQYRAEKTNAAAGKKPAGIRFRGETDFYPNRKMYAEEFDTIRARQEVHHILSPEDWERLRDRYVLFQWPLKPVERGSCQFFPQYPRHWRDTPIGHDFRIYQELNNLRWVDIDLREHKLDKKQYDTIHKLLLARRSEVKFTSIRKEKNSDKSLVFPGCIRFNLEDAKRKGLKPHAIGAALAEDEFLAPLWLRRLSPSGDDGALDAIFETMFDESDPEALVKRLADEHGLTSPQIDALLELNLSRATASVSRYFMERIVPVMRDQGLEYWDAVSETYDDDGNRLHHSQRSDLGICERLPYYGEILHGSMLGADPLADPVMDPERHFGRINNPTVHVALNCLRRVCNRLIERFGKPPVEIHLELARDLKQTRQQRDEISRRQAANQRENERIVKSLVKHGIANPSGLDIKKVKLWEELGEDTPTRRCPFTDKTISFAQLLNGDAEIEHILPFKRTLDDSMSNLTVAMRWANRLKGNNSPYEAFAAGLHEPNGIHWEKVRARAEKLPSNKSWRFGPDAMKRYEAENDFIARQLTDNAYIARAAQRYLGCLRNVQIVPNRGGLTALLRGKWHLNGILSDDNRKTREDHRHHAIDAAVIGLADRGILQEVSRMTARATDDFIRIEVPELPKTIEQAIRKRVPAIVTAFKPDHGWQGAMFKESAYGFVTAEHRDPEFPEHNLVLRKPLTELSPSQRKAIRDPLLRQAVKDCVEIADAEGVKPDKALAQFAIRQGVKSVRFLVKDQTVKPIPSAPYKGYGRDAFVCCDVWRLPKGRPGRWKKGEYKWEGVFWSYTDTPEGVPAPDKRKPHPAARFVARLFKNDLIAHFENKNLSIMRVAGFSTMNNKLDLRPHNIADMGQNHISINVVGSKGLRKLHVSPDGSVRGAIAETVR